jgi:DNA-3-methyladenine glycosylase
MGTKLSQSFYRRKTKTVAKELLGKRLVRIYRGRRLSGWITEVEAYLGVKDRACHSFGDRRTPRTEMMYQVGGHAYIYFIYGMYNCFNVVTEKEDVPEAVLIRALEPVEGIETMQKFRKNQKLQALTNGPGKLAQALQLTRDLNGLSLTSDILFLEDAPRIKPSRISKRTRIGVDYAGKHAEWLLRYYIKDSEFISKK